MIPSGLAGALFAVGAFLWWGLMPLYFKAVVQVPPLEVLAHRVVWSGVLLVALVALWRRWRTIVDALRERRTRLLMLLSTALIAVNWLIFIWSIVTDQVLQTSLGYYINPLMNVALGVLVLRERLSPLQALAIALAAAGVLNLALRVEGLPWIALSLATTFSLYGLIRKTVKVNSVEGLFLETSILFPFAFGYLIVLAWTGTDSLGAPQGASLGLLALAGPVTAVPLLLFASAARRLNYSTLGFFQYIAPTGQFLLAVFLFGEPFTQAHLVSFALIWTALAMVSAQSLDAARRRPA